MNTAIATNTASLSLVVDNTKELMSSLDIAENILDYRHDHVKTKIEEIVSKGVFVHPEIRVVSRKDTMGRNRNIKVYMLDERSSHILVAHIDAKKTAELYDAWDALRKENAELKTELANKEINPFANYTKVDWIKRTLELEEEKEQLVALHVRKSIDAHSMTRLLGEKRGSVRVQDALNALKEAGYITRRFNDAGKPCGYDLNESGYTFCRMSAHGQLEFTVDVLPVLVKLGVLAEEQKSTLKLPMPNNVKALEHKAVKQIRENVNSLSLIGFAI
ncbi:hypothetical protein YJ57_20260 [Salmonella enterica subsp. enterica]|nr:hypothetical protein [Salmonella enterica subsp. enterica]EDV1533695.1 hypothetical protein [Salmonella enterica subsp. enterica]